MFGCSRAGLIRFILEIYFAVLSREAAFQEVTRKVHLGDAGGLSVSCCCCSVTQMCPALYDSMDWSTLGVPVHHQLPELAQTCINWVGDVIQPSHPLSSPSPPPFNLSQQQGLFKRVSSSHQVAKVLEFQLQHQSFQWIFRTDFL